MTDANFNLSVREVINSLQLFKERRDDLMHEDANGFELLVERFISFCESDPLIQSVIMPLKEKFSTADAEEWWKEGEQKYKIPSFPSENDQEFILRYRILESVHGHFDKLFAFGRLSNNSKLSEIIESFRSLVLRPMMSELQRRLSDAANLATPEAREIQAVPLNRIPLPNEIKIFLSHKNENKELVRRYYNSLKILGFNPWMDESNMVAGSNLERELLQGFKESCAVIFFITEHFKDERYLATEIDYAVQQKRKKGRKFSIITLTYPDSSEVPELLATYIHRPVSNDLDGFLEVIKALPIELGPPRWKKDVL